MSTGVNATGPDLAALLRANSLVAVRRWQQAIDTLGPALTSPVTAAQAQCLRAQCLFGLRRPAEAGAAAKAALARDPGSAPAHRLLAMSHLARKRRRAARTEAMTAVRLDPQSVPALYVLALAHLALRERAKARQAAESAVAASPDEPLAHRLMAEVAESYHDWNTAEGAYRTGLRLDPTDSELSLGLARLLHRLGRKAEAAHTYLAAGRNNPLDARPRRGLAKLGLPAAAGTALLAKLAALGGARTVLSAAAGRPDRAALAAAAILALGCATTTALRIRGTRELPEQVREQLKGDHRNAALRWLQASAAVAALLAIWAALSPASSGGGVIEAAALLAYAAGAWFTNRRCWTGPRRGATGLRPHRPRRGH
jgi:tetratricopeptide (TPR) repeat protein